MQNGKLKAEDVVAIIIPAVIGILLILGVTLLNGLCITYLWDWYIVPLGVIEISIAHAIGIALVFCTLIGYRPTDGKKSPTAAVVAFPILSLIIGWVFHFWM